MSRFRRWRWAMRRHRGLRYWLSIYGLFIFPPFAVLFVVNGVVIGWWTAYNICILDISPQDTAAPWLALFLSLTGWLGIPALVGAVVGQIVVETSDNRRFGSRLTWRGADSIPRLDRLLYAGPGYNVRPEFPMEFVRVHHGDWQPARDHWLLMVRDFLDAVAVDESSVRLSSREILIRAVNEAAAVLPTPVDRCPHCARSMAEGGAT